MFSQSTIGILEEFCRASDSYWGEGGSSYKVIDSFKSKESASQDEITAFFNKAIGVFDDSSGLNNYQVALSEGRYYQEPPIYYSIDDDDCFATMVVKFKFKSGGSAFVEIFWSID